MAPPTKLNVFLTTCSPLPALGTTIMLRLLCTWHVVFFALAALPLGARAQGPGIDPGRLPGIVVDDTAARQVGTWTSSRHSRPFVADSYIHSKGGPGQYVEFAIEIKQPGDYQVLASYTKGGNRSRAALYE